MLKPKRLHNWAYKKRQPRPPVTKPVDWSQTIGSGDCWCGQRYGHHWPGEEEGAPHPR
jgi:hypothetical protein